MTYAEIKKELIVALRGDLSTRELSSRMGYSFDQVRRWEASEKQLRWNEFWQLCDAVNTPLAKTIRGFLPNTSEGPPDEELLRFFLHHLRQRSPGFTVEDLAGKLHCHPSVLKRYLKADIFPDLEFVLAFIDLRKTWLATFVLNLLPDSSASPLRDFFAKDKRFALEALRYPLAAAVEACLALAEYERLPAHDDAFIAERVGSTPDEVRQILQERIEIGTVRQNQDGKLYPTYKTINTEGQERVLASRMVRYWSLRSAQRFEKDQMISRGPVKSAVAYRIAPASKEAMNRINETIYRAHAEILKILEEDQNEPDGVRVILMHSFNPNDIIRESNAAPPHEIES